MFEEKDTQVVCNESILFSTILPHAHLHALTLTQKVYEQYFSK